MPELPDVENYCRFLKRHALNRKIDGVGVATASIIKGASAGGFRRRLKGHSIDAARRHGKHLFAALDDGGWIAFHFGMTGRFDMFRDGEQDPKHDRVRFDFPGGEHLAYVNQRLLGRVELVSDADEYIRAKRLGPDALDVDERTFAGKLAEKRGAIKSALMDQTLIAGIGNIYSDEILFHAKLHPKTPTGALDAKAVRRLYRAMRRVLETAIAKGAGAEDVERRVPKTWLLPHRRKGAACPRCGGKIAAIKVQSRTAYFCPSCQAQE
ncbi:MAG: DNA-formamidopyrimidine glycosylase [Gammaproteobacteria bacterium]|nr:DNA-formamidopyrimidine glycosylase [Gammaproteobacteria bacterium]